MKLIVTTSTSTFSNYRPQVFPYHLFVLLTRFNNPLGSACPLDAEHLLELVSLLWIGSSLNLSLSLILPLLLLLEDVHELLVVAETQFVDLLLRLNGGHLLFL